MRKKLGEARESSYRYVSIKMIKMSDYQKYKKHLKQQEKKNNKLTWYNIGERILTSVFLFLLFGWLILLTLGINKNKNK